MHKAFKFWLCNLFAAVLCICGQTANCLAQSPMYLVRKGAIWNYSTGEVQPPADWKDPGFDDAAWKSGPAGFGYGDSDDATALSDMQGRYSSVRIRTNFDIDQLAAVDSLCLYVNFDDGFIAYLNGRQIAAASVRQAASGITVEQHEAQGHEAFVIQGAKKFLRTGKNVLAIEGHNATLDSSDFSLDPFLTNRKLAGGEVALTASDYLADIDELERRLLDQSSYLTRFDFDSKKTLMELRQSIHRETQLAEFILNVNKLVMQIGDCHAAVRSHIGLPTPEYLPFRPADTADGVAALAINLNQPLDEECPYVESIDGVPLRQWMDAAARCVARGSPQLVYRRALLWMGQAALIRRELNLPASETVLVGLRSTDGSQQVTKKLRLTKQGYSVAQVRLQPTQLLDGNIGYLRIPTMDDRLVESLVAKVRSFRDTKGLIIDVRDNGGGTYGVLCGLYGFFVPDDAQPHVTNIAAYRLSSSFAPNHIEYRPTHRADWNGWSDQERAAIAAAAAAFQPEWILPAGKFSEWHYMILSRDRHGRAAPAKDYFFYDKPVVVLCNAGSFSAADGFLNAFADLPHVTLVGESSAGGSGAKRRFELPKTRVGVELSSMASFRASGKLFDGHGIDVDVAVKPALADYTTGADRVLQRAIAVLKETAM